MKYEVEGACGSSYEPIMDHCRFVSMVFWIVIGISLIAGYLGG